MFNNVFFYHLLNNPEKNVTISFLGISHPDGAKLFSSPPYFRNEICYRAIKNSFSALMMFVAFSALHELKFLEFIQLLLHAARAHDQLLDRSDLGKRAFLHFLKLS